jgi:HEAT repeat protein
MQALPAINTALDSDPDTEVKKQAVFALSRLPKDEGIPRLIELVRTHPNVEVRRQAIFWLGQSQDPRAAEFFGTILAQ